MSGPEVNIRIGDVVEYPDDKAQRFITAGIAKETSEQVTLKTAHFTPAIDFSKGKKKGKKESNIKKTIDSTFTFKELFADKQVYPYFRF